MSTPTVTLLGNQTVGQPLTLQCNVTVTESISNDVDIVWSDNSRRLSSTRVAPITMGSAQVYTDSYMIQELNTTDDGRVIQCEVVINVNPLVMADSNITLDVTGEYYIIICLLINPLSFYTQFPLLQSPYHHLVPYKELWWVVLKLSIVQ